MKRSLAPILLYVAVTVIVTFPVLRHFGSVFPHDLGDPVLNTWLLLWSTKHVPLTTAWWNAPMFYPATDVMALSELLLGLLPITVPVQWLTHNPVAASNVALLLSFPLSGLTAYALAVELTGRRDAALLAGLAYAFAPYRMSQISHLQVMSYYWAPLVVLALHRYVRTGGGRWLMVFGVGWLMQSLANGYALFHLSIFLAIWLVWFTRSLRTAATIVGVWAIAAIPLIPELLKYHQVQMTLHLMRDINEIKRLSLNVTDILAVPRESVIWAKWPIQGGAERAAFPGAMLLTVGFGWLMTARPWRRAAGEPRSRDERVLILASAVAAAVALSFFVIGPWAIGPLTVGDFRKPFSLAVLFRLLAFVRGRWMRSVWRDRSTVAFYVVALGALYLLALGPEPRVFGRPILYEAPYGWLMRLPGFAALRVPARFAMLMVLSESVLLAFAFSRLSGRFAYARWFVGIVAVGIMADGWVYVNAVPLPDRGPDWPDPVTAVVELPISPGPNSGEFQAIYRSMSHGHPIANGYSGYVPPHYLPFIYAIRERQFSALQDVAEGHLLGIGVNRRAAEAPAIEEALTHMAGVSRFAQDERWAMFMMQASVRRTPNLGAEMPFKSVKANRYNEDVDRLHDGRIETAWNAGTNQIGDEEIEVDLGSEQLIGGFVFDMGSYSFGFPRELLIDVSSDGVEWRPAWGGQTSALTVHAAVADPGTVPLAIDVGEIRGRYVRFQQVGSEPGIPWWIAELHVRAPAAGSVQLPNASNQLQPASPGS